MTHARRLADFPVCIFPSVALGTVVASFLLFLIPGCQSPTTRQADPVERTQEGNVDRLSTEDATLRCERISAVSLEVKPWLRSGGGYWKGDGVERVVNREGSVWDVQVRTAPALHVTVRMFISKDVAGEYSVEPVLRTFRDTNSGRGHEPDIVTMTAKNGLRGHFVIVENSEKDHEPTTLHFILWWTRSNVAHTAMGAVPLTL